MKRYVFFVFCLVTLLVIFFLLVRLEDMRMFETQAASTVEKDTEKSPLSPEENTEMLPREDTEQKDGVACTQEAKLCPDGSYVGRTGPHCEFTPCPTENEKETQDTPQEDVSPSEDTPQLIQ